MKKINLFLAVGDEDLTNDKNEISNFIRNLNDVFEEKEVYFNLVTDESFEQIEEAKIKESELFFVMLGKSISVLAEDEYYSATLSFGERKTPKITIYVKGGEYAKDQSSTDFIKKISDELKQYYCTYDNIDTIKLQLILQLENIGLEGTKIETKDDKIFVNNKEIMSLQNIPMFMNSKQLKELKKEYADLEKLIFDLKDGILKAKEEDAGDNVAKLEESLNIAVEKFEKVKSDISELEGNIMELEASFVKVSNEGAPSERQMYAKKCLDEGNLEEAKSALDFNEIKKDADRALEVKERENKHVDVLKNELKERIKVLKAEKTSVEKYLDLEICYKEMIELEKECGNLGGVLQAYIELTNLSLEYYDKDKMEMCLEKTKDALAQLGGNKQSKAYLEWQFMVFDLEEKVNRKTGYSVFNADSEKEENRIKEKIKVLEKLVELEENTETKVSYAIVLVNDYKKIALKYSKQNKHEKACECMDKSVALSEKMHTGTYKFMFDMSLQDSYNTAMAVYQAWGKEDASKKQIALDYMAKNVNLAEEMVKANPTTYRGRLAVAYNNYASLCSNIEPPRYKEVEEYYKKAIDAMTKSIKERDIPASYTDLSSFRKNLASFYEKRGDIKKAELVLLERISVAENYFFEKRAGNLFIGYEMAYEYITENFYEKLKKVRKAEKFYKKLEKKWKRVYKAYGNTIILEYLYVLLDKAEFYDRIGKPKKAEKGYAGVRKLLDTLDKTKKEEMLARGVKRKLNTGEVKKALRNNDKKSLVRLYFENGTMEFAIRNYKGAQEEFKLMFDLTKEDASLKEAYSEEIKKAKAILEKIGEI